MLGKPIQIDETRYHISDLVIIARQWKGCFRATWMLECPSCGEKHYFHRHGKATWVTECPTSRYEWTITPSEYYLLKPADFSRILGD